MPFGLEQGGDEPLAFVVDGGMVIRLRLRANLSDVSERICAGG